jgi:hypothetical protein
MSFEQQVREKHKFERSIREWFTYVGMMTREEIELCMGRIADHINLEANEIDKIHHQLKGSMLQICLDLRSSNQVSQNKISRATGHIARRSEISEYATTIGCLKYLEAKDTHNSNLLNWEKTCNTIDLDYEKSLRQWSATKKSFLKTAFGIGKPLIREKPAHPQPLQTKETFVVSAKNKVNLSDFLVGKVAGYQLVSPPSNPNPITPEEALLLCRES